MEQKYLFSDPVFEPYQHLTTGLAKYKAIYLAINLVLLGVVVYKLSMMGLLPVSPIDYIDLIPAYKVHNL